MYNKDEVAAFNDEVADRIIALRAAVPVEDSSKKSTKVVESEHVSKEEEDLEVDFEGIKERKKKKVKREGLAKSPVDKMIDPEVKK